MASMTKLRKLDSLDLDMNTSKLTPKQIDLIALNNHILTLYLCILIYSNIQKYNFLI